jgi:CHASE3 domain sensor protein
VIYVLYKKDITIQIGITTILLFLIMIFSFYNLTRSARTIEDNINRIEKNLVLENWNAIENDLKDIDRKWRQNEFILRIVNTTESIDRFEENLSQATILTKHKEDDLIDYIAPLRDTTRVITRIIPNP